MPAPQNNQGFVQPSSGGTGNWLSKLFGGIADRGRERSMAQLQLDLHAGKADIDTFHRKERTTWDMATKDAGAELGYDRAGREIDRGILKGPEMTKAGLRGFDNAGRPSMQATGQRPRQDEPAPTPDKVDTPPTPPSGGTPPPDRGSNPARQAKGPKERTPTQKDVVAAMRSGETWDDGSPVVDIEQAADLSPTFARNLGKKTASKSITNPDSPATPTKVRKPRTPKAGA
jgi:hypothetical protein